MAVLGKGYNQIAIGGSFSGSITVTETHLVLAAGLIGDFHPLHVDETYALHTRYGGRVLHGVFTAALVGGPVGTYFAGTGIAYLEHACRFEEAVRPGDTLTTTWTITGKDDKPRHDGGVVTLSGVCRNQHAVVVVVADAKLLVRNVQSGKSHSAADQRRSTQIKSRSTASTQRTQRKNKGRKGRTT